MKRNNVLFLALLLIGLLVLPLPMVQASDSDYIEKSVDLSLSAVGDVLTYTVTFRNPQADTLNQVVVTDHYDSRLENVAVVASSIGNVVITGNTVTIQDFSLSPGEEHTLLITAQISNRASAGDVLSSAATLESPDASIHISNPVETAIMPNVLPATGEMTRARWLIWNAIPVLLVMSVLTLMVISMRTYFRLREREQQAA